MEGCGKYRGRLVLDLLLISTKVPSLWPILKKIRMNYVGQIEKFATTVTIVIKFLTHVVLVP